MIQGTGSHVGKSVLVTAVCRLFLRRGLRVAPFKAQNMSNNSFVTPDGKEIGRAQAVQAAACRLTPRSDFNPILIKPSGERDAQLVVNGVVEGSLTASDFGRIKREYEWAAGAAVDRLRDEFDLIVLEGAGSPAEVNLRDHDIVNMHMAKAVNAPVILVGDIDRGGVLASLVGTMELLNVDERAHIKGFVINKFRGAEELLTSGIVMVEEKIQRPCLGVIPYWRDLALPEEDAVLWPRRRAPSTKDRVLAVGVVDVPCLSNFTDFDGLADEPDVCLYPVTDDSDIVPDLLIFPGTKHTMKALDLIKSRRIDRLARRVFEQGGTIMGICGGFQILGQSIRDPEGIESRRLVEQGLGLLDVETVFQSPKVTHQVSGYHCSSGMYITGYEVHMGRTALGPSVRTFLDLQREDEETRHPDGAMAAEGRVCGTYVHGLFDSPEFRRHMLNELRFRHGWSPLSPLPVRHLDQRIDQWADFIGSHINVPALSRIAALPGS
jgi:adenosylcobyric acid synthase